MKTECSIVRDLLPLYVENMVSEETAQYVKEHLDVCRECKAELSLLKDGEAFTKTEILYAADHEEIKPFKKRMKRLKRQFSMLAYSMIMFFIFLGFSFTAGENLMYNSFLMPIVGIFGYCVFRWQAIYKVPLLLLLIDLAVFAFQLVEIGFADTLSWTLIYSVFVIIGITIAFLLHFAFRKDDGK